jgi:hypothetical protein
MSFDIVKIQTLLAKLTNEHRDVQLLARMESFKKCTWSMPLSPKQCSLHGWFNSNLNTLYCKDCFVELGPELTSVMKDLKSFHSSNCRFYTKTLPNFVTTFKTRMQLEGREYLELPRLSSAYSLDKLNLSAAILLGVFNWEPQESLLWCCECNRKCLYMDPFELETNHSHWCDWITGPLPERKWFLQLKYIVGDELDIG